MSELLKRSMNRFVEDVVKSTNKNLLKKIIVSLIRRIARHKLALPLLVEYAASEVAPLSEKKNQDNKIILLLLNEERYRADIDVLAEHPEVELLSLPSNIQHLINSVWVSELRELSKNNPVAYFKNTDPNVVFIRNNLINFLQGFLSRLQKKIKFDAIATCTFYYRQDKDWEISSQNINIPFFALHKENMKDPVTHEQSILNYKKKYIKFFGTRIFLFNELEKTVLKKANISTDEKLSVVGGLRMDRIFKRTSSGNLKSPARKIVLFSFHHCVGLLDIPEIEGYFNVKGDSGFIEYFDLVHGMVAKYALENPDVEVVIKPKWEHGWNKHIYTAINRVIGVDASSIKNLEITAKIPAQTLIEESSVVIGINSTTLLEAKLYGRRVVVPLFAEAKEKYFDKHVYFHQYLNTFNTPRSPDELLVALDEELNGIAPTRELKKAMINDYLGVYDGHVADRVINIMQQDINEAKSNRNKELL